MWCSGLMIRFVSVATLVQSPARCSGLKDPVLLQLQHRWQGSLDSIPGPGISKSMGVAKKEKKKKKEKNCTKQEGLGYAEF